MIPVSTVWLIVAGSVLATFIISWFLCRKLKLNKGAFKRFFHCIELSIENFEDWFAGHWYTMLLIVCTVFVIWHFDECLSLKFSADFNGYNTIFIFWLILLIIPLFEKFEVSGLSIKTRKKKAQELTEQYKEELKAAMNSVNKQSLAAESSEEPLNPESQDE
ncbi:MAG: hypothetical protein K2N35_14280 [Muribaculaceae bacterium]|nr:hypothetical protein [Muribaculaceae bacterium]